VYDNREKGEILPNRQGISSILNRGGIDPCPFSFTDNKIHPVVEDPDDGSHQIEIRFDRIKRFEFTRFRETQKSCPLLSFHIHPYISFRAAQEMVDNLILFVIKDKIRISYSEDGAKGNVYMESLVLRNSRLFPNV
jgi:hypothetical protein